MASCPTRSTRFLPRLVCALALSAASVPCALNAQAAGARAPAANPKIASLIETLGRTRTPLSAALSPDGTYVAWTVSGSHGTELHLTGIAPAGSAQDGAWERVISPDTIGNVTNSQPGDCPGSDPAWSPDGKQLAFLSGCTADGSGGFTEDDQLNVFVWTLATNGMKQLSHLHGAVNSLTWSPDGKTIAFLYVENATRSAGALDAMKPWSGVVGEDGVEVQRVYSVSAYGDQERWLTPANLHVYEFSWAPASDPIVFVAAPPPGENNWWVAKLYTAVENAVVMSCGDGRGCTGRSQIVKEILDPATVSGPLHGLQIAVPRFSPDGTQIAFIGGLMSDQGSTGGDIYLIPATGLTPGSEPKDVTPNRPASPAYIAWLGNDTLGISEHAGGVSHLAALDLKTGKDIPDASTTFPGTLIAGTLVMSVSLSNTPSVAFIRQSYANPPEVWVGPPNQMTQLTHLNDKLKPAWGKAESIEYTDDGFHIQGWLLYPANYDPARKYPLIVSVHGGPSSAVTPRWPDAAYGPVPFSALGYFVFMPNPRGSFGQGEKFTQANVKDFGYGDLRDILAGVDVLERRFPIDKDREGLTGWSYGGFMTMFGVTQTTRFHAAVAGAGIADWQSYYGENSIDQWMVPFFGATVYDNPAVYAKSSPIDFIKNVKTPTLVVVGDRDGECPAPQSFEFWHALRAEGVPTQLVIYPNEGHRFRDPEHRRDVLQRALDWFETQMPARQGTSE